jgi:hypothetical protein
MAAALESEHLVKLLRVVQVLDARRVRSVEFFQHGRVVEEIAGGAG